MWRVPHHPNRGESFCAAVHTFGHFPAGTNFLHWRATLTSRRRQTPLDKSRICPRAEGNQSLQNLESASCSTRSAAACKLKRRLALLASVDFLGGAAVSIPSPRPSPGGVPGGVVFANENRVRRGEQDGDGGPCGVMRSSRVCSLVSREETGGVIRDETSSGACSLARVVFCVEPTGASADFSVKLVGARTGAEAVPPRRATLTVSLD